MEAVDGRSGLAEAAGGPGGVAFDFPAGEPEAASAPVKIPRRIRRRLLEGKNSSPPSSVEEIEAKLKEADIRRQQFHEWLSSKARPKPRSPSWSSQEEDLGQRLEAKLNAAEQKRLSLLAKAQMRLARLDELRQAAKTGVEMRFEKEREELGTKVESRVQQAEENRLRLLEAHMQRRAAAQERKARSVLQTAIRENKYKECVRSAIFQKRAAAEKKRMRLLEEEKTRAHARVMQVRRVAKSVCHQRESERRRLKEQLENRLQRAKCQRAEYLKQRGSPQSSARITLNKHGDFLSRKLARCWRHFVRSRKTTVALAKAFDTLDINASVVKSIPFDQLALRIQSATTLQTVKALLDRLESRFLLSQSSSSSSLENIDHLLKHTASPNRTTPSGKSTRAKGMTKKVSAREIISSESNKLSRYSVRVVLCAYMILGHPYAVFSEHGEREVALRESAANFTREFELLVRIILDGPNNTQLARQPSPEFTSEDWGHHLEKSSQVPRLQTFKSQLATFDAAWRSYLYCFVVWKVKDARSLEEDLVRAACHLELSMMKTCKLTFEGQTCNLSHDMRAIQKQVTEDQKLLREKVQHLSGSEGIERMEYALQDTRSKFFEAQENGSPLEGPVNISSPAVSGSSVLPSASVSEDHSAENNGHSGRVVRSLFGKASPSSSKVGAKNQDVGGSQSSHTNDRQIPSENELLVNEIVHGGHSTLANNVEVADLEGVGVKAKVQETMKKAFWDGIMESMKEDSPDYGRILALVKEVRDELIKMAPQSWKQDIFDSIDLEILSQVFESNAQDTNYLRRILENALSMLQKLSAPAKENEMKKAHDNLLNELTYIAQSSDKQDSTFVIAIIKGLRFVLEQIQALKKEISKARIQLMEPIIKGSAGLEYLQKAFADRYGPPSDAENSLPLTAKWISSLGNSLQEWNEHVDSLPALPATHGLPPVTALRTGGSISLGQKHSHPLNDSGDGEQPECKGEKIDRLLRVGLLKLASGIEGLTVETVPETLKLNVLRLRSVQSQLQQIIVVSTSMLVLRQILVSDKLVGSPSELENIISDSLKRLSELLENVPEVGIEDVVDTITGPSSEAKLQDRKEVMMRVLIKSLQNEDAVFMKVSKAIYLAARAVVFGGSGARGRKLAEVALSKVGASTLLDRVVKAAEVLIVVATISGHVHGPWYRSLVETNLG